MFGYLRPLRGELRVREYEMYRANYCGLCHALGRRCGFVSRLTVNYDLTFLAMLFAEPGAPEPGKPELGRSRCIVSPLKKLPYIRNDPALDTAADYSVILAYWKLRDTVKDEGFWKSMGARFMLLLLGLAYRRARARAADFDAAVRENLTELSRLESENCDSIDRTSDSFARILVSTVQGSGGARQRALEQLLYHTGRLIYLLDAVDDLKEDCAAGRYNPLIHRYELQDDELREDDSAALRNTMEHSIGLCGAAYELLDISVWSDILSNIIYGGLPHITDRVFAGEGAEDRRK